jgi:putative methyltransferase (TIGR04325 family)
MNKENTLDPSFAAASKACAGQGYEQEELLDCISGKTRNFIADLESKPFLQIDMGTIRTPLAIGLALHGNELNVIDFGGACGVHYFLAKKLLEGRVRLSWNIVETEGICLRGKEFENDELHFYSSLLAARKELTRLDLIYCSGALQYVADPYQKLQELIQCNARSIFLTRTALTTGDKDLIAVQRSMFSANGLGEMPRKIRDRVARYPLHIAQKEKFERILSDRYRIRIHFLEDRSSYILKRTPIDLFGYFAEIRGKNP